MKIKEKNKQQMKQCYNKDDEKRIDKVERQLNFRTKVICISEKQIVECNSTEQRVVE